MLLDALQEFFSRHGFVLKTELAHIGQITLEEVALFLFNPLVFLPVLAYFAGRAVSTFEHSRKLSKKTAPKDLGYVGYVTTIPERDAQNYN